MSYYKRILQSESVPVQLKKYISMLNRLRGATELRDLSADRIFPDILWSTDGSYENCMDLLCGYLAEEHIIDFSGERRYINIKLDDIGAGNRISSVCGEIKDMLFLAGGFRGEFKGVICIDIQSVQHYNRDFSEVMKFIRANSSGCLRIITANLKKNQLSSAEKVLNEALYRVYTVSGDEITVEKALLFLEAKFEEYGFCGGVGQNIALKKMLDQLIGNNTVRTLSDVDNLCYDVLFFMLGCNSCDNITEDVVDKYLAQRTMCGDTKKEKKRIGFVNSKEV